MSIGFLGKATLHLRKHLSHQESILNQTLLPFYSFTATHQSYWVSIHDYFYSSINICLFKVVMSVWLDRFWPVSPLYAFRIFSGTLFFPSLVSRGRACISIPRPRVWIKAFISCGSPQPSCPAARGEEGGLRWFGREPDSHALLLEMAHRSCPYLPFSTFKKSLQRCPCYRICMCSFVVYVSPRKRQIGL